MGEGEGGMNRETSPGTYTSPYVKWRACGNLLHDAGSPNPVLCDSLEHWDGVGWGGMGQEGGGRFKTEGTYVHLWLIHVDVWQKPT